jgi:hypothetical protein
VRITAIWYEGSGWEEAKLKESSEYLRRYVPEGGPELEV